MAWSILISKDLPSENRKVAFQILVTLGLPPAMHQCLFLVVISGEPFLFLIDLFNQIICLLYILLSEPVLKL